ncbi:hypothetical protein ACN38_g1891, partial [Penicillium nordicum]
GPGWAMGFMGRCGGLILEQAICPRYQVFRNLRSYPIANSGYAAYAVIALARRILIRFYSPPVARL